MKRYEGRIPSSKRGRYRVFPPRAVEIIRDIERENMARRGGGVRRKTREEAASEKALALLEKVALQLTEIVATLRHAGEILRHNPGTVAISIRTLVPEAFRFKRSADVLIWRAGPDHVARFVDADLSASGDTPQQAVEKLREVIVETYLDLVGTDRDRWTKELVRRSVLVELVVELRQAGR